MAAMSVPPVEPPCMKHIATPIPARMPPRITERIRSRWRKSPSGSTDCQKFSPNDMTQTQNTVFTPKFHPMMNPATSSSTPLIRKAIVPIWILMPAQCSTAWHSTRERPVAPPPVPSAGMMHPIHAKEYSIMPTVIRKYSLKVFSTCSIVMGFIATGISDSSTKV